MEHTLALLAVATSLLQDCARAYVNHKLTNINT